MGPQPFPQADSLSSYPRLLRASGRLLTGYFIDSLWSLREGSEHSPLCPSDPVVTLEDLCQTSLPCGLWWALPPWVPPVVTSPKLSSVTHRTPVTLNLQ